MKNLILIIFTLFFTQAHAEEVTLTHSGLTLNANLVKSSDDWTKGPVVLMTHGTLAHNGMEIMQGLQAMFAERSISSLAINLSLGLDDRHGMYDCKVPHTHHHTDALDEIGAWVNWLKAQGIESLSLLGHSRGGNQTAWFAAERLDPSIMHVFLIAPATWSADYAAKDYDRQYGKPLASALQAAEMLVVEGKAGMMMKPVDFIYCKETQATAEAFISYYAPDERRDTPTLISQIKAPVTVFAGSEDEVVVGLIEKTEPLADDQNINLIVIEGADHFFRDLYSEEIADAVEEILSAE